MALEEAVEAVLVPISSSDLFNCLSSYQQFKFVLVWTLWGFLMLGSKGSGPPAGRKD